MKIIENGSNYIVAEKNIKVLKKNAYAKGFRMAVGKHPISSDLLCRYCGDSLTGDSYRRGALAGFGYEDARRNVDMSDICTNDESRQAYFRGRALYYKHKSSN